MIVITPFYQNRNYDKRTDLLEETIASVNRQTIDVKHVIVDDGSPAEVREGLRVYASPERHIIHRQRKKEDILTCTNASNHGLEYVLETMDPNDDELVTFLHADDLAISLDKRERFMRENSLVFSYSDAVIISGSEEAILWEGMDPRRTEDREDYWVHGRLPYLTMTWTAGFLRDLRHYILSSYGRTTVWDPAIGCGEDVDLSLSTMEFCDDSDANWDYLPEVTAAYRIDGSSLASIRDQSTRRSEENRALRRHFGARRLPVLHMKRFWARPEVYIPALLRRSLSQRTVIPVEEVL